MNVLVTGASGFVGGCLARMLAERGHAVTALVRRTSSRKALESLPNLRFAVGEVTTGEGLEPALEGIDCVQHVAGVTAAHSPDAFYRANSEGTRLLCQAIASMKKPARLVYCSSGAVGGPTVVGRPRREEDGPAPVSTYGKSKLGGEIAVRQFADRVPSVIVRPPAIYGPGDRTNVPPMLVMARTGLFLQPGVRPKYYSWLHVADVCEGLLAAATRGNTVRSDDPTAGVYYLSDDTEYTWKDLYNALNRALGKGKARVVPVPYFMSYPVAAASELRSRLTGAVSMVNLSKVHEASFEAWTFSSERARRELEYRPSFGLESGFEDTIAWFRKEGML